MNNQTAAVLSYMRDHGRITQLSAFRDLRITRLSARIYDLKKAGYKIGGIVRTNQTPDGKTIRWKEYRLL